jgi:hypothetical protein
MLPVRVQSCGTASGAVADQEGMDYRGFHIEPRVEEVCPPTAEGSWLVTSVAISREGTTHRYAPPSRRFRTREEAVAHACETATALIDCGGVKV